MPKQFLKKYMPTPEVIRQHKSLQIFGTLLHDANLWHMNRRSVSSAFAVGLFCMMMPIPFQTVLAAAIALVVRSNLPISVVLVFISNPVTMPPMFYFAYKVGAWILQTPPHQFSFELSWEWLGSELLNIWEPFLLGCFVVGAVCSLLGYISMRLIWRWSVIKRLGEKRKLRPNKTQS